MRFPPSACSGKGSIIDAVAGGDEAAAGPTVDALDACATAAVVGGSSSALATAARGGELEEGCSWRRWLMALGNDVEGMMEDTHVLLQVFGK